MNFAPAWFGTMVLPKVGSLTMSDLHGACKQETHPRVQDRGQRLQRGIQCER